MMVRSSFRHMPAGESGLSGLLGGHNSTVLSVTVAFILRRPLSSV